MQFIDDSGVAAAYAKSALALMERRGVAAHPNNFAVFYLYAANRDPQLRGDVDRLIAANALDDKAVGELYSKYFETGDDATLRDATQRMEAAMGEVAGFLMTATEGAEQYGAALKTFSGRLAAGTKPDDTRNLVKAILDETRAMAEKNRTLEERLSTSSNEIVQLRSRLDEAKREASVDGLTGLANRKVFDATLDTAAEAAQHAGIFLSLLMLDIDHFKKFNDTHGHQVGDQVLKLVARCMQDCVREADTPARYGGEEFGVILPQTRMSEAVKIAEAIRAHVAGKKIVNRKTGNSLGQVTLSIGVAEYALGEPLSQFVQRADEALYAAKRTGRNRVVSQDDMVKAERA